MQSVHPVRVAVDTLLLRGSKGPASLSLPKCILARPVCVDNFLVFASIDLCGRKWHGLGFYQVCDQSGSWQVVKDLSGQSPAGLLW